MEQRNLEMIDENSTRHPQIKWIDSCQCGTESLKMEMRQNIDYLDMTLSKKIQDILLVVREEIQTSLSSRRRESDNAQSGWGLRSSMFGGKRQHSSGLSPSGTDENSKLRAKVDSLRTERERFRTDNDALERETKEWKSKCESLRQQNQNLQTAIKSLEASNCRVEGGREQTGGIEAQFEEVKNQNVAMAARICDLEQQNRKLLGQKAAFRDMVIKKGGTESDQVDDPTIIAMFVNLRTQIQKIVHKHYHTDPSNRPMIQRESIDHQTILEHWDRGLSAKEIKYRLRATMFLMIYKSFLSTPSFGLEDSGPTANLEEGLARFESALESTDPRLQQEVAGWRIQTIKCASWLSAHSLKPDKVAQNIQDFMAPLLLEPRGLDRMKADDEHHKLLLRLCNDAFKLALLLRRCQNSYDCEYPRLDGSWLPEEAEPQDWEVLRSPGMSLRQDNEVAYTLFGSLVKYPGHNRKERLVLEKAHIVLYKC